MNSTTDTVSIQALINEQPAGMKGLLAHEILSKQGRRHGPVDGKCDVCGQVAESFSLADHLVESVLRLVIGATIKNRRGTARWNGTAWVYGR